MLRCIIVLNKELGAAEGVLPCFVLSQRGTSWRGGATRFVGEIIESMQRGAFVVSDRARDDATRHRPRGVSTNEEDMLWHTAARMPVLHAYMSFLICLFSLMGVKAEEASVMSDHGLVTLDIDSMKEMVSNNDKVILLMHTRQCSRAESFSPTLDAIARRIPELAFGRIDVDIDPSVKMAGAFNVVEGAPALKALFRNGPPGKRTLEYRGPPTLEAVLDWCNAVSSWDGSDTLAPGWEVGTGKDEKDEPAREPSKKKGTARAHGRTGEKQEL
eukprot:6174134-Pleurochrysis_carterae.AAC.1